MSTQGDYRLAQRLGREQYQKDIGDGNYPYLQVLEELTQNLQIESEVPLGEVTIPIDQIVGTNGHGRSTAFARNFMPLLDESSEFAAKWRNLDNIHLTEGIRDPIKCYEFMNRFYVIEGNKRVSVLKYYGAVEIQGVVTRVIPRPDGSKASNLYQEFLQFYKVARINYLNFSKEGSYQQLLELVGRKTKNEWNQEFQKEFHSDYSRFSKIFGKMPYAKQGIGSSDAFIEYLKVYPLSSFAELTDQELKERLENLEENMELLGEETPVGLHMQPDEEVPRGIVSRITGVFTGAEPKELRVAFVHSKTLETSAWTYTHELGRMYVEDTMKDQVKVTDVDDIFSKDKTPDEIIGELATKNDVIFTTTPELISQTVRAAINYPKVKFLNCSVNMAVGNVRTYYGRMYEAKFLNGLVAGSMTKTDRIAYVADYPISGMIASINAFSRAVQLVNPRAKVFLLWSTLPGADIDRQLEELKVDMVSHQDMITPDRTKRRYGLYQIEGEKRIELAMPFWNWGKFYERIIRSIQSGSWSQADRSDDTKAINYWWGLSSGVIDQVYSSRLPEGTMQLIRFYKDAIIGRYYSPFDGFITDQNGQKRSLEDGYIPTSEIVTMDWLISNVVGSIPKATELTHEAQNLLKTTEESQADSEGVAEIEQ